MFPFYLLDPKLLHEANRGQIFTALSRRTKLDITSLTPNILTLIERLLLLHFTKHWYGVVILKYIIWSLKGAIYIYIYIYILVHLLLSESILIALPSIQGWLLGSKKPNWRSVGYLRLVMHKFVTAVTQNKTIF